MEEAWRSEISYCTEAWDVSSLCTLSWSMECWTLPHAYLASKLSWNYLAIVCMSCLDGNKDSCARSSGWCYIVRRAILGGSRLWGPVVFMISSFTCIGECIAVIERLKPQVEDPGQ